MIAALLDHLWQSTVFAGGVALLTLALRGAAAKIRYQLWLAASLKFLLPFSALVYLGRALAPQMPPLNIPLAGLKLVRQTALPFAASLPAATPKFDPTHILLAVWLAGFALVLLVWAARWCRIHAALRGAVPLALAAPIPVKATTAAIGPGLFGIWRPVLLLPATMAANMTPMEMRAILDHELCHLERGDNLTTAIHTLVESLFWFHPLVWWLGARLIVERERACDEEVVRGGNDASIYAGGILKVCRFYAAPTPLGAGVLGANLEQRLCGIMAGRLPAATLNGAQKILLGVSAALAIAWPLLTGLSSASASEMVRATGIASLQSLEETLVQNEKTTSQAGCESSFVTLLAQAERTYGTLSPIYPQQKRNDSDPLPMSIEWKNSRGASRYQLATVFLSDETAHVWSARKPVGGRYLDAAAVWSAGQQDKKAVCLTELQYQA